MTTDLEKKARKWLDEQDIFPYDFGDEMPPDDEDFYQEEDVYKAITLARQNADETHHLKVCMECQENDKKVRQDERGRSITQAVYDLAIKESFEKGKEKGYIEAWHGLDIPILWKEYAECDDAKLTDDAKEIKRKLLWLFEKGKQAGRTEQLAKDFIVKHPDKKECCVICGKKPDIIIHADCALGKGVIPKRMSEKNDRIAELEREIGETSETRSHLEAEIASLELELKDASEIQDVHRDRIVWLESQLLKSTNECQISSSELREAYLSWMKKAQDAIKENAKLRDALEKRE